MLYSKPVTEIIPERYSVRTYADRPLSAEVQQPLQAFLAANGSGPLGTPARFALVAATEQDRGALKSLGTYGFIKAATGFIVGAMPAGEKNLEDYGYLMERALLKATDLGLGTCWLGGTFTKSSFAKKIAATRAESVPAVTATGYKPEGGAVRDAMRQRIGGNTRVPWAQLFFADKFGAPLSPEAAGGYATPLEMVRLAPSASNKQPWRLLRAGQAWHFYLQRTPGYRASMLQRLMQVDDIQRVDLGIAMCHFALTAEEAGLRGQWRVADPGLPVPDALTDYTVTWVSL